MKKFWLGVLCGTGIGAFASIASAVIVGLRVRAMEPVDETVVSPDHH